MELRAYFAANNFKKWEKIELVIYWGLQKVHRKMFTKRLDALKIFAPVNLFIYI